MPLYVRDDGVSVLAAELQSLLNLPTKTEAVRVALEHEIERTRRKLPLKERLARAQAIAREIGPLDPNFDMKSFSDELWDEI